MASERIEERLRRLPARPGCYIMHDKDGKVLYVGKAASLRSRVPNYFRSPAELSPKIRAMVSHVEDFEYIVVGSELEALITENSLVKSYKPKYNTLLRDDKTFPYIVITDEPFPRVLRTRRVEKGRGRYFGPYANSGALNDTLKLLKKLFPYRSCALNIVPDRLPRGRHIPAPESNETNGTGPRPLPSPSPANHYLAPSRVDGHAAETHPGANDRACLDYYIHRCVGPCIGAANQEEYAAVIAQVVNFLEGKHELVLEELERQMGDAAEELNFERAGILRDQMRAVQRVASKQHVEVPGGGDQDVIGMARSDSNALVQLLAIRNGRLTGRETFTMENVADRDDGEVLAAFVQQYYDGAALVPPQVLVPRTVPDHEILEAWLTEQRGRRAELEVPQRGDKKRLLQLAADNAREAVEQEQVKWLTDTQKTAAALTELKEALGLPTLPVRLECFDISTIQGTATVASMVVFENGRPRTDAYRRFRIRAAGGPGEANDFAAMHEVIARRLKRSGRATEPSPPAPLPTAGQPSPPAPLPTAGEGSDTADLADGGAVPGGSVKSRWDDDGRGNSGGAGVSSISGPTLGRASSAASATPPQVDNPQTVTAADTPNVAGLDGDSPSPVLNGMVEEDSLGLADDGEPGLDEEDALQTLEGVEVYGQEEAVAGTDAVDDERVTADAEQDTSDAEQGTAGAEWTRRPDLIIVDGGKGQLNAALDALRALGIDDQPVAGLAKQNEELFLPNRADPVILPRTSQALYMVQRLRDEAHRFAITYHRNVRGKRALVSDLDSIQGVGGARKKALLRRFGSVSEIRRASLEEIAAVPGIGAKLAETIKSSI